MLWQMAQKTPLLPDSVLRNLSSSDAKAIPVPASDVGLKSGRKAAMLQSRRSIGCHVVRWDVVDVIARHVTPRAETVEQRSRPRHALRWVPRSKTGGAHSPARRTGCVAPWRARRADRARSQSPLVEVWRAEQQKRAAPRAGHAMRWPSSTRPTPGRFAGGRTGTDPGARSLSSTLEWRREEPASAVT